MEKRSRAEIRRQEQLKKYSKGTKKMTITHNNRKFYIKNELGTAYYIDTNDDVLACPLCVDGTPDDDELVSTYLYDFDIRPLSNVKSLETEIRNALSWDNHHSEEKTRFFNNNYI